MIHDFSKRINIEKIAIQEPAGVRIFILICGKKLEFLFGNSAKN